VSEKTQTSTADANNTQPVQLTCSCACCQETSCPRTTCHCRPRTTSASPSWSSVRHLVTLLRPFHSALSHREVNTSCTSTWHDSLFTRLLQLLPYTVQYCTCNTYMVNHWARIWGAGSH